MVDNSDVVLEVLDARDPLGCRCFKVNFPLFDLNAQNNVSLSAGNENQYRVQ